MPKNIYLIAFLLIVIGLTGCSSLSRPEQPSAVDFVALSAKDIVGQTFMAKYRGLDGFDVYLKPEEINNTSLTLRLYQSPEDNKVLAKSSLTLDEASTEGYYTFHFAPQIDSFNHDYYVEIDIDYKNKKIKLGSGPGDTYINGALYKNGNPRDAQLTFSLTYDLPQLLIGFVFLTFKWLFISLVGFFLYILPGWAILSLLMPSWGNRHLAEKTGLSIGVSLAFYPLLFLVTDLFGLHLGSVYTWLPPLIALVVLIWKNWLTIKNPRTIQIRSPKPLDLALLIIIILIIVVRFWVIRNLDAPMWGDSYHHTMISQLLVDNGGLFDLWKPYADLQTFTYHFGFHSLVATFHWITKLSLMQSTLWTGQIINVLAVLSLYPLAVRVSKNPWSGVISVLLAGLISPMPMFFVNWGRYTQLAGLAILPVVAIILWQGYESDKSSKWRYAVLAWLTIGGLALTHYRVLIFALIFLLAYLLIYVRKGNFTTFLEKTIIFGVGALILFLPWFLRVFSGRILTILGIQISTAAKQVNPSTLQYNAIGNILNYLPAAIWILFPISLGWSLWRRSKSAALIGIWWFFILLTANPDFLNLPGTGVINNFMVMISAYLPICIVIAAAIFWLISDLKRYLEVRTNIQGRSYLISKSILKAFIVSLFVLITILGVRQRINDIQISKHSIITRPDLRAVNWINRNLPDSADILVNSFSAYGGAAVVGSDGGWWLPLLTNTHSTQPPINYTLEQGPFPGYRQWINALTEEIQTKGINNPDVLTMLEERKISHIFIGQQRGQVGYGGPGLSPEILLSSPYFSPLYHQDRVWIFKLDL